MELDVARDVAETVAAALPGPMGRWLLAALDELGWLRGEARIPFDILDGAACPRVFRGRGRRGGRGGRRGRGGGDRGDGCGWREVVRLAVFGPALCALWLLGRRVTGRGASI